MRLTSRHTRVSLGEPAQGIAAPRVAPPRCALHSSAALRLATQRNDTFPIYLRIAAPCHASLCRARRRHASQLNATILSRFSLPRTVTHRAAPRRPATQRNDTFSIFYAPHCSSVPSNAALRAASHRNSTQRFFIDLSWPRYATLCFAQRCRTVQLNATIWSLE